MEKVKLSPYKFLDQVYHILGDTGALLVSAKKDGSANVMAIGWALIGRMWEKDFALVAVRPSRHTFGFIEESGEFTINIPTNDMKKTVEYCGTVSGRDEDKFKRKNLTLLKAKTVNSPIIEECCLHYECKVTYKIKLLPTMLPKDIISANYTKGDFHTLYLGEILSVLGDKDVEGKLKLESEAAC
jgi:flavin reductase (DIM6/NTAB) family NADH-FMN oxidoreductase RutF